jgi:hypothetical protein
MSFFNKRLPRSLLNVHRKKSNVARRIKKYFIDLRESSVNLTGGCTASCDTPPFYFFCRYQSGSLEALIGIIPLPKATMTLNIKEKGQGYVLP